MKSFTKIIAILVSMTLAPIHAQAAYCALRDPTGTLKSLFPSATSHKSIVKIVGEDDRKAVGELMPPNVLHFSELGQHTLYVAFEDKVPLGYVHVRSEESEWGLVEIAWAMDTELNVIDYKFQRCRSRDRKALEQETVRSQFRGLNFSTMKRLLAQDNFSIDTTKVTLPKGTEALAGVLVRCGLKTLLVTQLVWREEIARYSSKTESLAYFDNASFRPIEVTRDRLDARLNAVFPNNETVMDPASAQVIGVYNAQDKALGAIYKNTAALGDQVTTLEWHISIEGQILDIRNHSRWQDAKTEAAFESVIGETYLTNRVCSDRPALMTKQAVVTSRFALDLASR